MNSYLVHKNDESLGMFRSAGIRPLWFGLILWVLALAACKENRKADIRPGIPGEPVGVTHAKGFRIYELSNGKVLELLAIGDQDRGSLWYGFAPDTSDLTALDEEFSALMGSPLDHKLRVPLKDLVSNSTTHVAALDMLDGLHCLSGFSHTNLVSSENARRLIEDGTIREAGAAGRFDPETLISIGPELILTFGPGDRQKELSISRVKGVPVLPIGEWLEASPLGRAEWIKVFGLITGQEKRAMEQFEEIEERYLKLKRLQQGKGDFAPLVLSGSQFKDIFYAPGGDGWMARLISDAGGRYLWEGAEGSSSLQFSVENVVHEGQSASIWLGCGQYEHMTDLRNAHPLLLQIDAVRGNRVFTYMGHKGETGGVLFFEQATYRPDWLLSDAVHIIQSGGKGINESELHFFSRLGP